MQLKCTFFGPLTRLIIVCLLYFLGDKGGKSGKDEKSYKSSKGEKGKLYQFRCYGVVAPSMQLEMNSCTKSNLLYIR
jgi:hypothetical protein